MFANKRTEIITFLLGWLLTYGSVAAEPLPTVPAKQRSPSAAAVAANVVVDACSLVSQFAKDEAAFSTCAIMSGNNMCKQCVNEVMMLTNSYTKLMADDSVRRTSDPACFQQLMTDAGRDRFHAYYQHSRHMWYTNNCDNCFLESSQQLSHDVESFFNEAYLVQACMEQHVNGSTCDKCQDVYSSLNSWYELLDDDYQGNVCLDVTAVMVNFRGKWFELGCISPVSYDLLVILIGCIVITACLLLYVLSRKLSRRHEPELLTQKRLATFIGSQRTLNADETTHLLGPNAS